MMRLLISVLVLAWAGGVPSFADEARPAALATLQPGQWLLRARDGATKTLCLGDIRPLLQIGHPGIACTRYPLPNASNEVVVSYSCGPRGNGRTSVRMETPRLIQVQSQGIADGDPFDRAYEGRFVGPCPVSPNAGH